MQEKHLISPQDAPNPEEDHPLAQSNDSAWARWFDNEERLGEIRKDLLRLHPGDAFFQKDDVQAALAEVLLLWSKEHPQMGYRQGMHELLSVFVLVFGLDRALLYGIFDALLTRAGVMAYYSKTPVIDALVQSADAQLYAHLWTRLLVEPQFYLIRWLRLLFVREFSRQEVYKVWDSVLACHELAEHICVAVLVWLREELLEDDAAGAMKRLMKYPAVEIDDVVPLLDMAWASMEGKKISSFRSDKENAAADQLENEKAEKNDKSVGLRLDSIVQRLQRSLDVKSLNEEALLAIAELKQMRDAFLYNMTAL
jgi:hypothetical protein